MSTHLEVLSKSYLMNTNMTGFRWFSKILVSLCLDESSLSMGRVNKIQLSQTQHRLHSYSRVIIVLIQSLSEKSIRKGFTRSDVFQEHWRMIVLSGKSLKWNKDVAP